MHVEAVDPAGLDQRTAQQIADVSNASAQADGVDVPPFSGPVIEVTARYGSDGDPYDGLWVARDGDGVCGTAWLQLPRWDNRHLGMVFGDVHPDFRGRGIGTALLDAQRSAARQAGRRLLSTYAFRDTPASRFLQQQGFEVGSQTTQRRLTPPALDYDRIRALADEAVAAAGDYELVPLDGPTPEPRLDDMSALFEAINDAPLDEADMEEDKYPVERVRRYEAGMAARRQHVYRLIAQHRRTGEWVGFTILCVDELRPGVAFQEDTSVMRAHRGHRLGILLKARMLLWMREVHPELQTIDTWNADSNTHMVAVNERLGCFVVNRGYLMQNRLE